MPDLRSRLYEIFRRRLVSASHWLIVGYGFGDVPVRVQLIGALEERRRLDLPTPRLLVIDRTSDPATLGRSVASTLSLPTDRVSVDGSGVPDAVGAEAWQTWAP